MGEIGRRAEMSLRLANGNIVALPPASILTYRLVGTEKSDVQHASGEGCYNVFETFSLLTSLYVPLEVESAI